MGTGSQTKAGHVLRPAAADLGLQVVGAAEIADAVAALEAAAVGIAGSDVGEVGQPGGEGRPRPRHAAEGHGPEGAAVVPAPAGDHQLLGVLAPQQVILAGDLQGCLDRLGAAGDEVGLVEVARGRRRQPRGIVAGGLALEVDGERVGQGLRLLPHDPGDVGAPVAQGDVAGAGGAVDVTPALVVVEMDALAADDRRVVAGGVLEEEGALLRHGGRQPMRSRVCRRNLREAGTCSSSRLWRMRAPSKPASRSRRR